MVKILNAVKFQEKKKDGRKNERNFEKNKSIEKNGLVGNRNRRCLLFCGLLEHSFICFLFDCPPWTILGI